MSNLAKHVRFSVLGPVRAWRGEQEVNLGSPKQRAVLALLALHARHPVRLDEIVEFVWADSPPPSVTSAVHTYVRGIRRVLHPDGSPRQRDSVLRLCSPGYRLDAEDVDLLEFRRALAAVRRASEAGCKQEALTRLRSGIGLWQDRPLADLHAVQRGHPLVAGLEQEYLDAVVLLADAEMETGNAALLLPRLQAAAAWAVWHEPLQLRLVRAFQMAEQRAEALRVYEQVRRRLREELGVDPGTELQQAFAELLAADATEAEAVGADCQSSGPIGPRWLGKRPDPEILIGRDADLSALRELLASRRVVTLVGAGGVGKTALGLRLAEQVAESHLDGVAVVQFGTLPPEPAGSFPGSSVGPDAGPSQEGARNFDDVTVGAVAELLGVQPRGPETMLAAVTGVLRGQQLLLMLDNAEHVCGSAARLVDLLVRSCPSLQVLVTSRRRLGVAGETVWEVTPLLPPAPGASEAELRDSPAAQLFLDRAARRCPGCDLSAQWELVGQLCRDLEGLPLAIDLATARLGSLSLADLAERMFQHPALLADTAPHRLPHQRALDATLSWSLRLLPDDTRDILVDLSVFASSFTLAAAEAMAGPDQETTGRDDSQSRPVAERLAELVDVSLVQARPGPGGMSYRILVPVREGVLHAAAPADLRRARTRQLRLCASLARPFGELGRNADDQMVTRSAAYSDDFAAAVRWALHAGAAAEHDLTADLLFDSVWLWRRAPAHAEKIRQLVVDATRQLTGVSAQRRARLWFVAARLSYLAERYAETRGHLEQALRTYAETPASDPGVQAECRRGLAAVLSALADARAVRAAAEAVRTARAAGDSTALATVLRSAAPIYADWGMLDEAERAVHESRALDDDPRVRPRLLHLQMLTGSIRGDLDLVETLFARLTRSADTALLPVYQVELHCWAALAAARRGRLDTARRCLVWAGELSHRSGGSGLVCLLETRTHVERLAGDHQAALHSLCLTLHHAIARCDMFTTTRAMTHASGVALNVGLPAAGRIAELARICRLATGVPSWPTTTAELYTWERATRLSAAPLHDQPARCRAHHEAGQFTTLVEDSAEEILALLTRHQDASQAAQSLSFPLTCAFAACLEGEFPLRRFPTSWRGAGWRFFDPGWPARAGLAGFRCTGRAADLRANVPESTADAGRGEPARRGGPFPGAAQLSGERAAQAQLGVAGDDQPGPPVRGRGIADLRRSPPPDLLEQPEGVLNERARLHVWASRALAGNLLS